MLRVHMYMCVLASVCAYGMFVCVLMFGMVHTLCVCVCVYVCVCVWMGGWVCVCMSR